MKIGAMPWPGLVSAIVAVLLLLSAFAAVADPYDDALRAGTRAYIDSQTMGLGEGWVRVMMEDIERDHATMIVGPLTMKQFMISSACEDQNPHCPERIGTWAHAVHSYTSPLPERALMADDVVMRLRAVVDELAPPPMEPTPPISDEEERRVLESLQ
jgi:hypothetical protein